MAKHGKKYLAAAAKVDDNRDYTPGEAIALAKETVYTKFDQTVEVPIRLGVDPRHADQQVRDVVVLPHGLGKTVRVLVFAQGEGRPWRVRPRNPGHQSIGRVSPTRHVPSPSAGTTTVTGVPVEGPTWPTKQSWPQRTENSAAPSGFPTVLWSGVSCMADLSNPAATSAST